MPIYIYCCNKCEAKIDRKVTEEEYEELALFETSHAMEPTPDELKKAKKCPRCGSTDCSKSYAHHNVTAYIRGNGYLDKDGTTRDRNVYTLDNNDPYAEYRVAGEVDHIKSQLKAKGKHDPKTQHYVVNNKSKPKGKKK
jgi:hypothetical protein